MILVTPRTQNAMGRNGLQSRESVGSIPPLRAMSSLALGRRVVCKTNVFD